MNDLTMLWVLIGLGLLFSALVAALKIGLWVWIATRFFGRPEPPPSAYYKQPVMRPSSASDRLKKWLTIIATVLGIVSTTVGLVKGCTEKEDPEPGRLIMPYRDDGDYRPRQRIGYRCCTPQATCNLMTGGLPVGSQCVCMHMFGSLQGTVCD